jgi:hypothetical protein
MSRSRKPAKRSPSGGLARDEIRKVQSLFEAGATDGITLGLSLLQSLGATAADYESIFTDEVMGAMFKGLTNVGHDEDWGSESAEIRGVREVLAVVDRSTENWRQFFTGGTDSPLGIVSDVRFFDLWAVMLDAMAAQDEDLEALGEGAADSFFGLDDQGAFLEYSLPRLTESTSAVIGVILSQNDHGVDITSLPELSELAAKALAQHIACEMDLSGICLLPDAAAEHIARYEGELRLDGLKGISDETAKHLAKHTGPLYLNGLLTLSDAAAEALGGHTWGLWMDGLTELSVAAAQHLSRHKGTLSLNGIQSVGDEVAAQLGRHQGNADLGGVGDRFETEVVHSMELHGWDFEANAYVGGALYLDGITHLSDEAAQNLAQHDDVVGLRGLKVVSGAALEVLRSSKNILLSPDLK